MYVYLIMFRMWTGRWFTWALHIPLPEGDES
jgi:hypothetical protein